jgi:hypothetical protein
VNSLCIFDDGEPGCGAVFNFDWIRPQFVLIPPPVSETLHLRQKKRLNLSVIHLQTRLPCKTIYDTTKISQSISDSPTTNSTFVSGIACTVITENVLRMNKMINV